MLSFCIELSYYNNCFHLIRGVYEKDVFTDLHNTVIDDDGVPKLIN